MRWLLFLSRIAFLSNVFFALAVSIQIIDWIRNPELVSTILVIGYLLAAIFNPLVNLLYILFLPLGRRKLKEIPTWLMIANFLFLVLQIFYIIYLNDTRHP
ncbi:MAG TPA: hypothetical protein VM368_08720 [Flavisolibacter sp.]|nr:hypothetical protein [Flavisolibacter sp.]